MRTVVAPWQLLAHDLSLSLGQPRYTCVRCRTYSFYPCRCTSHSSHWSHRASRAHCSSRSSRADSKHHHHPSRRHQFERRRRWDSSSFEPKRIRVRSEAQRSSPRRAASSATSLFVHGVVDVLFGSMVWWMLNGRQMGSLTTRRSDGDVAKRVRERKRERKRVVCSQRTLNKLISGNLQQVKLKVARAQSFFQLRRTANGRCRDLRIGILRQKRARRSHFVGQKGAINVCYSTQRSRPRCA